MPDSSYSDIKDPVIRRMMRRFDLAADAESDNRRRGLSALKFRQGGRSQWDESLWDLRGENNQPRESYNQIPQFVHQVTNDMRMNMAQTRFIPGNDGSKEVAEIYEDLTRAIQSSSEGEIAYDAAADSQVTVGWGYWRYYTDYEDDKGFDQIIKIGWIPNPFTVYDDPTCAQQDRLDRKWLIQVCDLGVDDFNNENDREYSESDLQSIGDSTPDWSNGKDTVRIAEYWEIEHKIKTISRKIDGKEEKREVRTPKVIWRKCTALEVLEEREWPGEFIPYVFVPGEQLMIDGKMMLTGLVEHMIPAQKLTNYSTNAAIEMVGMAPIAPFILDPEQIAGYQEYWDKANIKKYPFLPYRRYIKGIDYGQPSRMQNQADIGSWLAMSQMAQEKFYETSGIYPASLGQESNEKSGKAIMARQREGDVSTFHFPDNMARAQRAGGRILKDLIPKIYDGARVISTVKEDRTQKLITVNKPYYDEEKGQHVNYDLTVGTYDVMVTTGPNYTTKRQEAAESMTQMIQAAPQLMEIAGDLLVSNMDWPGADKLAERLKKTLPPGLADEKPQEIPPQVQQQMQMMTQQLEMLAQQLEQAQAELQSKQADNQLKQADLQIKMQDLEYSAQSDQMKAENDKIKLALDAEKLRLESEKLELEREKAQIEMLQMQIQQAAPQLQQQQGGEDMQLSREALTAQLKALDEQEMMKAQEAESQRIAMEQQAMMQAQKEQQEAQKTAINQELLMNLIQSVQNLTTTIAAPRQLVRDPNTGLAAGVQIAPTIQPVVTVNGR